MNKEFLVIIFFIVILIFYAVYLIYAHSKNKWPFDHYNRISGPPGSTQIPGSVSEMTPEEIQIRDAAFKK
jgi:hypothetical protein